MLMLMLPLRSAFTHRVPPQAPGHVPTRAVTRTDTALATPAPLRAPGALSPR
jgi:hypothetical protein